MGKKGLIHLDNKIHFQNNIKLGPQAARDLINNRLVISIDPGLENLVGGVAALGEIDEAGKFKGNFMKMMKASNYYLFY